MFFNPFSNFLQQTCPGPRGFANIVDADGNVTVRDVTLGAEDAKGIQILSGLVAGDMVVTMSFAPPKDGSKVNVISPDGGSDKDKKGDKGDSGLKGDKDKSGQTPQSETKPAPAAGTSK